MPLSQNVPGRGAINSILSGVEAEIYQIYSRAAASLMKIADDYLANFIVEDQQRAQAVQDGTLSVQDYQNWRISHMATGKRWYEAAYTMAANMTNYNQIAANTFGVHLPEVYTIGFNADLYQFEQQLGFMTSFTMFDIDTVERLIRESPDLLPSYNPPKGVNVSKSMQWDRRIIASEMTQSILQGETIENIASRLASKCAGMDERAAIRTARTAFTSAENGGRYDNLQRLTSAGVKMSKTWIATLDSRTRDSHRWVDGETVENPNEEFSNGLLFPGDPDGDPEEVYNCRCTMISSYKGYEHDVMKGSRSETFPLWSRDGEFIKDVTYDEWKGMKKQQSSKQSNKQAVNPDNPSYGYSGRNPARINPFQEYGYATDMGDLYDTAGETDYNNGQPIPPKKPKKK